MATLLAVAVLACAAMAQDDAEPGLARARLLVRQGLLAEADRLLEPLARPGGPQADDVARAHALLLRGNIAFERGAFEVARAYYDDVGRIRGVPPAVMDAAQQNAARAGVLLARAQTLSERAVNLGLAVALATVAGGALCAVLARRAAS